MQDIKEQIQAMLDEISSAEVSSNVTRTGKGYIDYAKGLSKAVKT